MLEIMKETFDTVGLSSFWIGMILSVGRWFADLDYGLTINILTVLSLGIGIVYFAMRMYHQVLETRKLKREERNKNK